MIRAPSILIESISPKKNLKRPARAETLASGLLGPFGFPMGVVLLPAQAREDEDNEGPRTPRSPRTGSGRQDEECLLAQDREDGMGGSLCARRVMEGRAGSCPKRRRITIRAINVHRTMGKERVAVGDMSSSSVTCQFTLSSA